MPKRYEQFTNGEIFHVFNKTINSQNLFDTNDKCSQFIERVKYYRSTKSTISYSHLNKFEERERKRFIQKTLLKKYFKVEILVYSLMPTHFHFLLRQNDNNGIQNFISNAANSFTRYHNIKYEKLGPLFLPRFKSVKVTSEEQAMHVSRYIHLNLYSSGLCKNIEELVNYKWSSFKEYVGDVKNGLCDKTFILGLFNFNKERYKRFVFNNADYQKSLEHIKYTNKW